MGIKFKIIIIFILSLIPFVFLYNPKKQPENIISTISIKQKTIEDIEFGNEFFNKNQKLKPTESLSKNFAVGSNLCGKKRFYSAFEHEYCTWEYVKTKSINDYKILENIRKYCLDATNNECDRRFCIDKIIGLAE